MATEFIDFNIKVTKIMYFANPVSLKGSQEEQIFLDEIVSVGVVREDVILYSIPKNKNEVQVQLSEEKMDYIKRFLNFNVPADALYYTSSNETPLLFSVSLPKRDIENISKFEKLCGLEENKLVNALLERDCRA